MINWRGLSPERRAELLRSGDFTAPGKVTFTPPEHLR